MRTLLNLALNHGLLQHCSMADGGSMLRRARSAAQFAPVLDQGLVDSPVAAVRAVSSSGGWGLAGLVSYGRWPTSRVGLAGIFEAAGRPTDRSAFGSNPTCPPTRSNRTGISSANCLINGSYPLTPVTVV